MRRAGGRRAEPDANVGAGGGGHGVRVVSDIVANPTDPPVPWAGRGGKGSTLLESTQGPDLGCACAESSEAPCPFGAEAPSPVDEGAVCTESTRRRPETRSHGGRAFDKLRERAAGSGTGGQRSAGCSACRVLDRDLDVLSVGERADARGRAREDTSPGSSVNTLEANAMISGIEWIISRRAAAAGAARRRRGSRWRRPRVELGLDDRAERAERVVALGAGPLAVGLLDVAGGDVVARSCSRRRRRRSPLPSRRLRSLPITMASSPSCSTCELSTRQLDGVARPDHGGVGLQEDQRGRRAPRRPSPRRGRRSSCRRATTFERGMTGASSFDVASSGTRSSVVS